MNTVARPTTSQASHFYWPDGRPCYEVENKSKGGMRPTTVSDMKKLGLLPSPTTILKVLAKPELQGWLQEQTVLAVLSTPRLAGEELDAFVHRVLHEEKVQDQESQKAMQLGTDMHDAVEQALLGNAYDQSLDVYVKPVLAIVHSLGRVLHTEKVVIGTDYAGKTDCIVEGDGIWVLDFKTCKAVPKKPYREWRYQLASYAYAFSTTAGNTGDARYRTANIAISTTSPGDCKLMEHEDWGKDYTMFRHALELWKDMNGI